MAVAKKKMSAQRTAERSRPTSSPAELANLKGWQGRVVDRSLERATRRTLERANALIDAAIELLNEDGSDGFTVQEVANRAGQSLRTFYQHFGSKNDLLLAVFEEEVRRHAARLEEVVSKYDDPIDRLTAYVVAGVARPANAKEQVALAQYRIELAASRPDDISVVQRPVVELARRLVNEAMEAGAIPAGDADPLVYILVALKSAVLHSAILGNELGVRLPDARDLARFCLGGLGGTLPEKFPIKP